MPAYLLQALRKRTNILLKQANRLIETAEFAEKSVQVLHEAKDEWRNTECRLRTIARRQSTTVNEIIKLVKENEAMLDEIKVSLMCSKIQTILICVPMNAFLLSFRMTFISHHFKKQ